MDMCKFTPEEQTDASDAKDHFAGLKKVPKLKSPEGWARFWIDLAFDVIPTYAPDDDGMDDFMLLFLGRYLPYLHTSYQKVIGHILTDQRFYDLSDLFARHFQRPGNGTLRMHLFAAIRDF